MAKALFLFGKPSLTSFHLRIATGERGTEKKLKELSEAFEEIGKRASSWRRFSFSGPLPEKGAFREIVRCSPLLEEVYLLISGRTAPEIVESHADDIVQTFADCPNLHSLQIFCPPVSSIRAETMANKWYNVRFRTGLRAEVFMNDEQYPSYWVWNCSVLLCG